LYVVSMMWYGSNNRKLARGTTVLEMVVAMSILTVVFVATIPLFTAIRNSWDTRQADAEVVQNGRVVIEHLFRNLIKAVRIAEVSSSSETATSNSRPSTATTIGTKSGPMAVCNSDRLDPCRIWPVPSVS
jgi:Tfp pilus assembly protein PilW